MSNDEEADPSKYEAEIFNELYDLMEYCKPSMLFENLDVFKVSKFFDKYSYFDITTEYYNEDIMDDMYYMDDY